MKYEKKISEPGKKKIDWPVVKEKFLNSVKAAILAIVMLVGFWAVYIFMWYELKFPITDAAMWLLFLQAVVSEAFFFKWAIK